MPELAARAPKWAKLIDHTRCIGCHACSTACKSENLVPLGVNRTYVKYVDVGQYPTARRAFQVTRCNQCEAAPCTYICPTGAMHARPDGIVDFDKSICIGCKACMAACPYDAIFINPDDNSAEKCNFCAHRLDVGLEPACVVVCPTQAILIGHVDDPQSLVGRTVAREPVAVRRPEKETRPKLFYKGAHQATLDPLGATRPGGGIFMWSEQAQGPRGSTSGHPTRGTTAAEAVLAYDVPHSIPWGPLVSLYTVSKGIAAGVYLVALALLLFGHLDPAGLLWRLVAPAVALGALGATGAILIADLKHPGRFWMLFARGRWQSWLVRGAVIIAAYGAVLAVHAVAALGGAPELPRRLGFVGLPLAVLTAIYTAYLFAQSHARDMWQSSLLPPHLLVQAVLAGAAFLVPVAAAAEPAAAVPLAWVLAGATALHLLFVLGEVTLPHATAHGRLAGAEMTAGRWRGFFRLGVLLGAAGLAAPALGSVAPAAAAAALLGLLSFEHAYVQAGQSVPLA